MPNWIEGSLKLRGNSDHILNFIENGLNVYKYKWNEKTQESENIAVDKSEWLEIDEMGKSYEVYFKLSGGEWVYVEDTRRAFLDFDYTTIFNKQEEGSVAVFHVRQAWGFEAEDWLSIANVYDLDISLYGVECGMGFWESIEIGKDKDNKYVIIKNDGKGYESYEDFQWECPFPWFGG